MKTLKLIALSALAILHAACMYPPHEACLDCVMPCELDDSCEDPSDSCELNETRSCLVELENGDTIEGVQLCEQDGDDTVWAECVIEDSSSATPLLFAFDNQRVTYTNNISSAFDLAGTEQCMGTHWPTAATPWLALDRNGDGRIADGSELFGSMTRLSTGVRARNGFEALRELDSNHDGIISAADASFSELSVWADRNQDRTSQPEERSSLSKLGIIAIELDYTVTPHCDAFGNCERERARFHYKDANGVTRTGTVIDVHLKYQTR